VKQIEMTQNDQLQIEPQTGGILDKRKPFTGSIKEKVA